MPISDSLIALRQWQIVVLPFPYADRLAEKRRPAVIVSKPAMSDGYGIVWVAMITSATNAGWGCDIPIEANNTTGLPAASVIRPYKLATVDAARVIRVVGRISSHQAAKVSEAVIRMIAS